MPRFASIALPLLLIACDPADPEVDAGADGGQSSGRIATPAPPAAPDWGACPDGWEAVAVGETTACAPWVGSVSCPTGQTRFVGDAACGTIGDECPSGVLPEGLSGEVVYVSVGGRATGDGTRSDPLDSIDAALASATPGTTVALGRGEHTVTFLELPPGVRVVGACASETVITSAHTEPGRAMVAATSGESGLANVTLRGDLLGVVAAGGTIALSGVVIDRPRSIGVLSLARGRVTGSEVVVHDVQTSGGSGGGIVANGGAVELSRVEVLRVPGAGVATEAMGGTLSVTDARLADALPGGLGAGFGVDVEAGSATLERVLVEGGEQVGVKVGGAPAATLTLRDVVIRDVPSSAAGGAGILAGQGATLEAERLLVARIEGGGLQIQDSTATVTDLVVDGSSGAGVLSLRGSEVTLTRALLRGGEGGLFVSRMSSAQVEDLRVEDTTPSLAMPYAPGALVVAEASLTLERAAFVRTGSGVIVGTDSTATLDDLLLADHTASHDDLLVGTGLVVAERSEVILTRAHLARALGVGIAIEGAGSRIDALDLTLEDTRERRCPTSCGAQTFGSSVVATEGGNATLTRFEVRGSALAGLRLLTGGTMDLADGEVRGHPIGLDLQTAPFDAGRVSARVAYLDNERNVARSEVPPPDVTIPEI